MFPYFKNILMLIRSTNLSCFTKGEYSAIKYNASRTFCQCGRNYKNYKEEQIRFNGVRVTIDKTYVNDEEFESDLCELLTRWKTIDNRRSAFLEVPISQSNLISIAAQYGFIYHHARDNKAVLSVWLDDNTKSKLPHFANHTVGVAGACFNQETMDVLLVQDKGRFSTKWWKFPGGFSEKGEFIGETAVRETFEETGIRTRLESVLSIREQHGTFFDQSDLYFICRLHPLTTKINSCPDEIERCEWIHINKVLSMPDSTPFVKIVCQLLLKGVEYSFSDVDISGEETMSWLIPDRKYILYHRTLTS